MSEFHDDFPSYETLAHHSEEEGKTKRKKLWQVFWIMLAITLVELYIGFKVADWHLTGTFTIKFIFITLTLVKAAYIVLSFMHLGDEERSFRYVILIPFCVFVIYLVTLVDISEGTYSKAGRYGLDENVIKQKQDQLNNKSSHDTDHKSQSH
ncbi:MAG: cytochrome C oxidase subunit IV family protein [Bacteroidia bacterium]